MKYFLIASFLIVFFSSCEKDVGYSVSGNSYEVTYQKTEVGEGDDFQKIEFDTQTELEEAGAYYVLEFMSDGTFTDGSVSGVWTETSTTVNYTYADGDEDEAELQKDGEDLVFKADLSMGELSMSFLMIFSKL